MEELFQFNINHLKFFFDAATLGSVSKAARKNLVSQSAISQGIKSLEGALSCQLLEHRKSRFALTKKGEKVFAEARGIIRALLLLQKKVKQDGEDLNGCLTLGLPSCLASTYLAEIFLQCRYLYPRLAIRSRHGDGTAIREGLLRGSLDAGLIYQSWGSNGLAYFPVGKGCFRIYRSSGIQGHPTEKGVYISESAESDIFAWEELYKKETGEELRLNRTPQGWDMVEKVISIEGGFAVLPEFMVKERKLKVLPVGGAALNIPYELGITYLKGQEASRHIGAVTRILRDLIVPPDL